MIAAAAAAWLAARGTTSFFDILEAPNALLDALLAPARVGGRQRAARGAVVRGHREDGRGQRFPLQTAERCATQSTMDTVNFAGAENVGYVIAVRPSIPF